MVNHGCGDDEQCGAGDGFVHGMVEIQQKDGDNNHAVESYEDVEVMPGVDGEEEA